MQACIMFLVLLLLLLNVPNSSLSCPLDCKCTKHLGLIHAGCSTLNWLSAQIESAPRLQSLDISGNLISYVGDDDFLNVPKLQVLNASRNHIAHMSRDSFLTLKYVRIIDLSGNNLQVILPDLFRSNEKLRTLILSGNKFTGIDSGPFLESSSIEILDMSHCLIPHLHEDNFSGLPSLSTLRVNDNLLLYFDSYRTMRSLEDISIKNNPMRCDEKTTKMIAFFLKSRVKFDNNPCKAEKMIAVEKETTAEVTTEAEDTDYDTLIEDTCPENDAAVTAPPAPCPHCWCTPLNMLVAVFVSFLLGCLFSCGMLAVFKPNRRRRVQKKATITHRRSGSIVRRIEREMTLLQNEQNVGQSTPVLPRVQYIKRQSSIK